MSGHIARRARLDDLMTASSHQGTPRSTSWTRPKNNGAMTDRTIRSVSVSRVKSKADEAKEEEQREMARAAFEGWLKRKCKEPRMPRASPSREQISQHLKEDVKHRVYNDWLHNKKFEKKASPNENGTSS